MTSIFRIINSEKSVKDNINASYKIQEGIYVLHLVHKIYVYKILGTNHMQLVCISHISVSPLRYSSVLS